MIRVTEFYKRIIGAALTTLEHADNDGLTSLVIVPIIEGKFINALPLTINSINRYLHLLAILKKSPI
jgi:hypothetical protein